MSITGIRHVSGYTLELIKQEPQITEIFLLSRYVADPSGWCANPEVESRLRIYLGVELFEKVRKDIFALLAEGKTKLDLSTFWRTMHFFYTGASHYQTDFSLLVDKQIYGKDLVLVNAVIAGTMIHPYPNSSLLFKYLQPDEVKQVLEGLLEVSEENFEHRWEILGWVNGRGGENSYKEFISFLKKYHDEVITSYHNAAEKGDVMLLELG